MDRWDTWGVTFLRGAEQQWRKREDAHSDEQAEVRPAMERLQ